MYSAGTTLKLNFGTFFHYGIADGQGNVIHNSKKKLQVAIDSYNDFADGKEIEVSEISSTDPTSAVTIAISYIGLPYNLVGSNCEHFARLCHGLRVESTQIQQYLFGTLGAGIAVSSNNNALRLAGSSIAIASLLTPAEESPFKNAVVITLVALGIYALTRT